MRPSLQDHPIFAETYIRKVREEDPVITMTGSIGSLETQLGSIPEDASDMAYAPGKWTVRQAFRHVIDTERIFAYRALCIARGERQVLPSFDEGDYAREANAALSGLEALKEEFLLVRRSTVALFSAFPEEIMHRSGTAGGGNVTVNALAYMIIGHWRHHAEIFRERYGLALPDDRI